ncbi:hypothetical protein AVEN_132650-1 [Araneus ventricosus]|uniref:Uncharacterized protein n=1 Tax=Araneus ventricosus TaxID=182803 RepID=A0A4Y2AXE1_ARAVE|nr:hypothetical protein AVEN_132650-1 [Araneus ventricosus]
MDCIYSIKMGDKQQCTNKNNLQNKAYPQALFGKATFKNENRSQCVKLKPLIVPKENVENSTVSSERKVLIRLNPNNQSATGGKKRNPSKIPVLQKTYPSRKGKCDFSQFDTTLSAADRRQKFHQSRLHVAPPSSSINVHSQIPQQKERASIFKDFFPWQPGIHVNEFISPNLNAYSKVVLPPIQNVNPSQDNTTSSLQVKKKCLIGEITHFPALCNLGNNNNKHVKKSVISQVPHLPPIFSTPAAPPNSKALSLEQDTNKVYGYTYMQLFTNEDFTCLL